jgi:hypothetical protein
MRYETDFGKSDLSLISFIMPLSNFKIHINIYLSSCILNFVLFCAYPVSRVYKVVSKSPLTVIVVSALVKENERGGQGHTSTSLLYQSSTWHCAVNKHCFYTNNFLTSCFILSVTDSKFEQYLCIKFCVKLSKSATKPPEMIGEALGEHSLSQTEVFEWHSCFKACWVSWRWTFWETKHQQNNRKC